MLVTLLYFDGCPNWPEADTRLRQALDQLGAADVEIERVAVTTPEQAESLAFRGSPTVLLDGRDPFAEDHAPVGLSCRVYRNEDGLAGAPSLEQLVAVLR